MLAPARGTVISSVALLTLLTPLHRVPLFILLNNPTWVCHFLLEPGWDSWRISSVMATRQGFDLRLSYLSCITVGKLLQSLHFLSLLLGVDVNRKWGNGYSDRAQCRQRPAATEDAVVGKARTLGITQGTDNFPCLLDSIWFGINSWRASDWNRSKRNV